uniref:Uncharacterized protein n=1 Tax=Schistocephalus solidus TaxID=70667 RepID=A0A0V0J4F9_SCHSO
MADTFRIQHEAREEDCSPQCLKTAFLNTGLDTLHVVLFSLLSHVSALPNSNLQIFYQDASQRVRFHQCLHNQIISSRIEDHFHDRLFTNFIRCTNSQKM